MGLFKKENKNGYTLLIDELVKSKVINDERLRKAFLVAERYLFVPEDERQNVSIDAPISIPGDQTNSQPTTVAIMLRELGVLEGESVLDVGFGSGWTTALLVSLVGERGEVYGIEVNSEVYGFGSGNVEKFKSDKGIKNIYLKQGDGREGWEEKSPFDRILVSAGAGEVPENLLKQLAKGGRMVIPVDELDGSQTILILDKQKDGSVKKRRIPGFRFVRLV